MYDLDSLQHQIYSNMQLKTTEELKLILEQNDHEEWSDTAFEVVRQILIQRTGELPAASTESAGMPIEWENKSWQAIFNKYNRMVKKSGPSLVVLAILFLVLPIGFGIYSFFLLKDTGLIVFAFCILLGAGLYGYMLWSYFKIKNTFPIVARARVFLKHTTGFSRGSAYDVDFAIQSAYTLSEDGVLLANGNWNGHRTLTVPRKLYDRIEEQDIVNLIYLSNNQVIGLLEDFDSHKVRPNAG